MQRRSVLSVCFGAVLLILAAGGCDSKQAAPAVEITVANSYLNAAVQDLCGPETPLLDLVPPGMCPGHFDISPGQINQLCHCKVLLVFGFQSNVENAVARIRQNGLKVCKVCPREGLCLPQTYLDVVTQIAGILSEQFPHRREAFQSRLAVIEARLAQLESRLLSQADQMQLKGTSVLASGHQAEFAKWLGLDVVATFSGGDTETAAQINAGLREASRHHIKYVIANQQEGTALAGALATRLQARAVVFSNFPNSQAAGKTDCFDALLWENMQALTGELP